MNHSRALMASSPNTFASSLMYETTSTAPPDSEASNPTNVSVGERNHHINNLTTADIPPNNLTNRQWIGMAELNPDASDTIPVYMQHMTVILVILHVSVFITGLVGNSLVCLSVYRNKSLQTVTNYYIVNLAVADFLVILICLPPTVYWDLTLTWNFGLVLCKLVLYLQSISVSVSVLTLTCISIDRWYAICKPLEFCSTKSRAKNIIALIWLVSMVIASPDVIFLTTRPLYEEDNYVYMDCTYSWPEENTKIYQLCIVTLLFALPFGFMTISYSHIVNVLWRNETMTESVQQSIQAEEEHQHHTTNQRARIKHELDGSETAPIDHCGKRETLSRSSRFSILRTAKKPLLAESNGSVYIDQCVNVRKINPIEGGGSREVRMRTDTSRKANKNGENDYDKLTTETTRDQNDVPLTADHMYKSQLSSYVTHERPQLNLDRKHDEQARGTTVEAYEGLVARKNGCPNLVSNCHEHDWYHGSNLADAHVEVDHLQRENVSPSSEPTIAQDVAGLIPDQPGNNLGNRERKLDNRLDHHHGHCHNRHHRLHHHHHHHQHHQHHQLGGKRGRPTREKKVKSLDTRNNGDTLRFTTKRLVRSVLVPYTRNSHIPSDGYLEIVSRLNSIPDPLSSLRPEPSMVQGQMRLMDENRAHRNLMGIKEGSLTQRAASICLPFESNKIIEICHFHRHHPEFNSVAISGLVEQTTSHLIGDKLKERYSLLAKRQMYQHKGIEIASHEYITEKRMSASSRAQTQNSGFPSQSISDENNAQSTKRGDYTDPNEFKKANCIIARTCNDHSEPSIIQIGSRSDSSVTMTAANDHLQSPVKVVRPLKSPSEFSSEGLTNDSVNGCPINDALDFTKQKIFDNGLGNHDTDISSEERNPSPYVAISAQTFDDSCWFRGSSESIATARFVGPSSSTNLDCQDCCERFTAKLTKRPSLTIACGGIGAKCLSRNQKGRSCNQAEIDDHTKLRRNSQEIFPEALDGPDEAQPLFENNTINSGCNSTDIEATVTRTTATCAISTTTTTTTTETETETEFGRKLVNKNISHNVETILRPPMLNPNCSNRFGRDVDFGINPPEMVNLEAEVDQPRVDLEAESDPDAAKTERQLGAGRKSTTHQDPRSLGNIRRGLLKLKRGRLQPNSKGSHTKLQDFEISSSIANNNPNDVDHSIGEDRNDGPQFGARNSSSREVNFKQTTMGSLTNGTTTTTTASSLLVATIHDNNHASVNQRITSSSSSNNTRFYKLIESRKKAAKMLIVIVIMFGLCYLPIHFLNTLRYTIGLPQNDLTTIASLVSHWLCYFNSAVNPLIYNLMSGKFRHEFANLFFCRCFRRTIN